MLAICGRLPSVAARCGSPGVKLAPWSAVTTTSERSYWPLARSCAIGFAEQAVPVLALQQVALACLVSSQALRLQVPADPGLSSPGRVSVSG